MRTFEPRRALRSISTHGMWRSAATAAANIPAAPPPTIASLTGLADDEVEAMFSFPCEYYAVDKDSAVALGFVVWLYDY